MAKERNPLEFAAVEDKKVYCRTHNYAPTMQACRHCVMHLYKENELLASELERAAKNITLWANGQEAGNKRLMELEQENASLKQQIATIKAGG